MLGQKLLKGLCVLCVMSTTHIFAQNQHAFFVGVETYDPVFLTRLKFAEDDAQALGTEFQRLGYSVTVMTRFEENPRRKPSTAQNILDQLQLWLSTKRSSDTVVLGFSGHGVQFSKPQKLTDGTEDDQFFCPESANLKNVNSLVSMKKVLSLLQECKAERSLLLVDACRNEVLSDVAKSGKEIELDPAGVTPRTVPKGTVAMFSCAQGEKSYELPSLQHGAFCYHVLKFLRGEAPSTEYRDDRIGVRRMLDYTSSATRLAVYEKLSKDQYPETVGRTTDWEIGIIPTRKEKTNSLGMKLKLIPAGEFMMGSKDTPRQVVSLFPDEKVDIHNNQGPQVRVTMDKPFYIGTFEVTHGQFRQFIADTRYRTEVERGTGRNNPTGAGTSVAAQNWRNPGHIGLTDDHPVSVVSHNDAKAFCQWLSKREGETVRLPTQAEWEYACRAGTSTRYSSGDNPESLVAVANVPNRTNYFQLRFNVDGSPGFVAQVADEMGQITFTGNRADGFRFAEKNTGNSGSRVTIINDMQDFSLTLRTQSANVTIARGGSQTVSLPKERQWVTREFEFEEKTNSGWLKSGCKPGADVSFRNVNNRWIATGHLSTANGLDADQVTFTNESPSRSVKVRINGRTQILSPGQRILASPGEARNPWFVEGGDGYAGLAPVGQYLPNGFGLFDMHGNVWEWCDDGLDGYNYSSASRLNPRGPAASRKFAMRGACFL